MTSRLLPEGNSHVKSLWPMVRHVMSRNMHNEFVFVSQCIAKKKDFGAKGLYNLANAGGM